MRPVSATWVRKEVELCSTSVNVGWDHPFPRTGGAPSGAGHNVLSRLLASERICNGHFRCCPPNAMEFSCVHGGQSFPREVRPEDRTFGSPLYAVSYGRADATFLPQYRGSCAVHSAVR
jgi:hypothetical protein